MAFISSALCSVIFVFSGKIILYPLSIIVVTYCVKKKWRANAISSNIEK